MQRAVLTILFCLTLIFANNKLRCQSDTSNINWWYPSSYIPPEEHWIEDSTGIVCVQYDSATNEFRYGPHASHIKWKKWKITTPYDCLACATYSSINRCISSLFSIFTECLNFNIAMFSSKDVSVLCLGSKSEMISSTS